MARGDFRQRVIFEVVDKASEKTKSIAFAFGAVTKAVGALVAARALASFVSFLNAAATAAAAQETADRKLTLALKQLLPAAEGLLPALKAQADELQRLGIASNETVQGTQALIANLGVAPEKIGLATQAAADLSAALGISLESAARNVARTVGGMSGELGEVIPELRELSVEALKAGAGIELLAAKFGGQAAGTALTYAKSVDRLNEALADTSKVIGKDLASPGAAQSVRNLALSIEQINDAASGSKLSGFFSDLASGARNAAASLLKSGAAILEYSGLLGAADEASKKRIETSRALEIQLAREGAELAKIAALEAAAVEAQTAFTESAKLLGVTLEDAVNAELETNNALLIEADRLYRLQVITRLDFENVTRAVLDAEVDLNEELTGVSTSVGVLSTGFREGGLALEQYIGGVSRLASSMNGLTASAGAAARATAVLSNRRLPGFLTTSPEAAARATAVLNNRHIPGLIARDPRDQADVDKNIGSDITGRVRIRGGSRLVIIN